jgi:outer membrane lipoprotein SlyB
MQAVENHQSGSTRIRPLVTAAAASVAIAGLIGVSAFTGMLPTNRGPMRDEVPSPRSELKPGQAVLCALCGTIESVRMIEVYYEPSAAPGAAEPKTGAETVGSPGGAIASGGMSVLDTLAGIVPGGTKDVRKRLVWRVTLRMDDGSFRTISASSQPAFAVGDRVRVVEGRLVRA